MLFTAACDVLLVCCCAAMVVACDMLADGSQRSSKASNAGRKDGTGLTVDVLQAEATADQARARYATAIVRYNQSQINLLAALGLIDQTNVLRSKI